MRIGAESLPEGKIGDEEELKSAEENGAADAKNGAAIRERSANQNAQQEAGIDNGNEAMKAHEEVSSEESQEWKQKSDAAIMEHRAGEDGHGTDGSEIPRVRKDSHHGGEDDHYGCENGAKNEKVSGRFIMEHHSNQTSI